MKLIGNIGGFFYLATSIAALGSYKKKIEALKAAGKQEEERQVIEEVCRYWSDKVASEHRVGRGHRPHLSENAGCGLS